LRTRILPLLALGQIVLLAVWILLAPAEAQLGNIVKLIYLHGALVWVSLFTFSVAGVLGLVALVLRRPIWCRGTAAAGMAAVLLWSIYSIMAMIVTGLTWGQAIAWNEPRVQATALILLAAVVLLVVTRLVDHCIFTAVVNLMMGIVPWVVVRQAGVIRHPVNPIRGSESVAIQTYYLLIVLTVASLAGTLIAWLWAGGEVGEQ
jgi:heme exporter protein C